MAIEITQPAPVRSRGIRNTEPLDRVLLPVDQRPTTDSPFSMMVDVVKGQERELVTVPGVQLRNPEFAAGYYWGQSLYFNEVNELVDQTGRVPQCITESDLPFLREVKVCDVTDQQVMDLIAEIMCPESPGELHFLEGETTPLAFRAGLIFGYVATCVEEATKGK